MKLPIDNFVVGASNITFVQSSSLMVAAAEPGPSASQDAHYHDSKALSAILFVVSFLSLFGALSIILSSWLLRSFRYFRHRLILGLAISDAILTSSFLVTTSMRLFGQRIGQPENHIQCAISGFMTQMFVVQSDYWALVIAICTFYLLGWGGRPATWITNHALAIWLLPWVGSFILAGFSLWLVGYGDVGGWCWFTRDQIHLFVNYIPRWTIIFTIICIYISLFRFIHLAARSPSDSGSIFNFARRARDREQERPRGGSESFAEGAINYESDEKNLRKAAMRMMKYPIVYMIIWIIPTVVHIYHAVTGNHETPEILTIIEKSCVAGQGLFHAIIYSCTEKLWERILEKCQEIGGVDELPWHSGVELTNFARANSRLVPTVAAPRLAVISE